MVRRMEESAASVAGEPEAPRPRLDRETFLDAAQAIVAREGVEKLTMRRIGAVVGADSTALYRHFRNKDELLLVLADRLFGSMPELDPALSWREALKAELRHAMHRYRSHPDLAVILAVQPDDTPSLQAVAERLLGVMAEQGLSPQDAAMMLQLIENHVVGTGLYYANVEHRDDPRTRDPDAMRRVYAMLPADRFPHAVEAAPHLFPGFDESFDFGTELILDAIERLAHRDERAPRPSTIDDGAHE